jgi:hypothetical protein
MNCVPKGPDGVCVHLDPVNSRCRIWNERPRVCREYDCRRDDLLALVLRDGFTSLTQLVKDAVRVAKPCAVRSARSGF